MARLEIRDADDNTVRTLRVAPGGLIDEDPVDPQWEHELRSMNVVNGETGALLRPEDGDKWLYWLQVNYRSIYFRGVYIEE
jgi:hypothetical protein